MALENAKEKGCVSLKPVIDGCVPTFGRLVRDVADFVQLRTENTASDSDTARSGVYPMKKC